MPSIEIIIENLERLKEGLQRDSIKDLERSRLERLYAININFAKEEGLNITHYELYFKNYILYDKRRK